MNDFELNEDTYELYAMKSYDNPCCKSTDEFYEDLGRTRYIKRLLRRYVNKDEIKERLLLNHLIVFGNVFGPKPTARMLFYHMEQELWPALKTFLVFLNYIDDSQDVCGVKASDIPLDGFLVEALRNI